MCVGMWVQFATYHHIDNVRQHRLDIGVKVERDGDADMRANNCAYFSGKIGLRCGDAINHQRSVQ